MKDEDIHVELKEQLYNKGYSGIQADLFKKKEEKRDKKKNLFKLHKELYIKEMTK